ncbi:hypothetical protein ACFFGH_03255 [Lysobacter korlensis]|uniref:Lipoprotein n=1 Tax=Lysobacter korlensis TaxID=553636 RepID=A0ABV6RJV9_9GAMM
MNASKFLNALSIAALGMALAGCSERPATAPTAGTGLASASNGAADTDANAAPVAGPQFEASTDTPALTALASRGTCSLENVVDTSTQTPSAGDEPNTYRAGRGATYRLIGFSTDSEQGAVPSEVQLLLHSAGQSYALAAQGGLERQDVASYFKKPGLANAGYQADAGFANVVPGRYEVFAVNTFGSDRILCPTHQAIIVE